MQRTVTKYGIYAIIFLSLIVNCDLIALSKEAAYDNEYLQHEKAIDAGWGRESDIFDIALAGGYSTDTIKQILNDGYLNDYLDLMKQVGIVQADFFPNFDASSETTTIPKKDTSNTIYKEVQDDLRIFIDEQTKELIVQSCNNVVAVKISDALLSQRVVINIKDYPVSLEQDGVKTWVIDDFEKYLVVIDNHGRTNYYVSAAIYEENGGYWLNGYLWGDARYVEAGTITIN